jgi:organic hydroperoxide reductase OsmC/OhrA
MLWFLDHAVAGGFIIETYQDAAEGVLARGPHGRLMMTRVTLRPALTFGGERRPTPEEVEHLHHLAHESCFIANSVTTEVAVEPVHT